LLPENAQICYVAALTALYVHIRKVMKSLSIIFASLIATVALISYAAEQTEETQEEQKSTEQASSSTQASNSPTKAKDEKLNTLEYQAPELKTPTVDTTKPDDSKVLGSETPKPVEKPKKQSRKSSSCGRGRKSGNASQRGINR
jgi:hypothetical protein